MKIAVYDCVLGDALTDKYGPVARTVTTWIAPHLPEAEFIPVHVAAGAPFPDPATLGGVIISGSEKGVYDDTSWMGPLRDNLLALRAAHVPVFGICFGHQIMADVYGGRAEKVDTGFITGAQTFEAGAAGLKAYVAHQDQVTRVPPEARVIASAPYCPAAALAYEGAPALSVQFHPEYSADFARDLIDMFGAELMPPDVVATSRASITGDVPTDLYGAEVATFFRGRAA